MGHRANGWRLFVVLLLLAAAACGKNQAGDAANAPTQKTEPVEAAGPESESLPASIADHTFKTYYAWRYYAPNGTFENSDVYGTIAHGHWWMKGDEVCAQFDEGGAKPLCAKPDYSALTPGRSPE